MLARHDQRGLSLRRRKRLTKSRRQRHLEVGAVVQELLDLIGNFVEAMLLLVPDNFLERREDAGIRHDCGTHANAATHETPRKVAQELLQPARSSRPLAPHLRPRKPLVGLRKLLEEIKFHCRKHLVLADELDPFLYGPAEPNVDVPQHDRTFRADRDLTVGTGKRRVEKVHEAFKQGRDSGREVWGATVVQEVLQAHQRGVFVQPQILDIPSENQGDISVPAVEERMLIASRGKPERGRHCLLGGAPRARKACVKLDQLCSPSTGVAMLLVASWKVPREQVGRERKEIPEAPALAASQLVPPQDLQQRIPRPVSRQQRLAIAEGTFLASRARSIGGPGAWLGGLSYDRFRRRSQLASGRHKQRLRIHRPNGDARKAGERPT